MKILKKNVWSFVLKALNHQLRLMEILYEFGLMINSWTMTGAVMINPYMTLKKFIKLQPRDMMNGAVYDEIYYALKRLDEYENGTRKSLELTDAPDTKVCDNCNKTYQKPVGKDVCPHCGY